MTKICVDRNSPKSGKSGYMVATWIGAKMARARRDAPVELDKAIDLTAGAIERLVCPTDKQQVFLRDAKAPGLRVRVTAGAKSFVFEAKLRRQTIRRTIGDVRAWTIERARVEANRLRVLIDAGQDPRELERQEEHERTARAATAKAEVVTFGEAWTEYVTRGKPKKKAAWKPRYLADMQKMASRGGEAKKRGKGLTLPGPIAPLLDTRLKDITPRALRGWHSKEAVRGAAQAARAVQIVSGFLRWCSTEDAFEGFVDPLAARDPRVQDHLPSASGNRRTDALEEGQLAAWFEGIGTLRNRTAAVYLQGLLLTGARREELAALKWSDVDFRWKKLTIADKVGDTRTLPLTPYLSSIMRDLPRIEGNGFVFASPGAKSGRIADPRAAHASVLEHGGIGHVTLHGLRRTFALMGEQAGCPAGAIAQVMGHRPGSMSERYKPRTMDQLRPYLERLEIFVLDKGGVPFVPDSKLGKLRAVA
ncbi:site-specific integrase [Variovorax sp. CCNWLW186]|uniref:tyrosine-type recombinase/integrase n=1 Tax=Variovorax sp. CCNWLW186 TaxID=3127473 RepID=UPI003077B349